MLTPDDIKRAVGTLIRDAFPDEKIYQDIVPRDFERPCTLIELEEIDLDTESLGHALVGIVWKLKLTGIVIPDAAHNSHLGDLDRRGMRMLAALSCASLRAGTRHLAVRSLHLNNQLNDAVELNLSLSAAMTREDLLGPDLTHPFMETVEYNMDM